MEPMAISALIGVGKSVIERIWPDPQKQAEEIRKLEEMQQQGDLARLQLHVQMLLGQLKINEKEAEHSSIFVAGWRPAVGWVCVCIMAFNYIGVPILEILPWFESPDQANMADLWPVLLGMLGIGGMRSVDKRNGVARNNLS